MKEIQQAFMDNSIRVESIYHLGLMMIDSQCSDDCYEMINDNWDRIWRALDCEPPCEGEGEKDDMAFHLYNKGKQAFVVEFATPVPRFFGERGSFSMSWGMYSTTLIYSDTVEDACMKAIKWRDEYIEEQKENQD